MLNRRHLRIKVLQALYAFSQNRDKDYARTEKELLQAIEKMYDLYLYLLLSFEELKTVALNRMEDNKKKLRPTDEDLNPNRKFVDNALIEALDKSALLKTEAENRKVSWEGDENREMFRKMFLQMREGETFFAHMNNEVIGFEEDRTFLIALFKEEIANNELFQAFFEEKDIDWSDDLDLCCSMVIKTLKNFSEEEAEILPLYKDKEDELNFVKDLLRKSIKMEGENEKLIDGLTTNWDLDRIARMDMLLMNMAITELQIFKSIPTKVTINEYLELSKYYSTPKSNVFINGVLDKAVERLKADKKIVKTGRGLTE